LDDKLHFLFYELKLSHDEYFGIDLKCPQMSRAVTVAVKGIVYLTLRVSSTSHLPSMSLLNGLNVHILVVERKERNE